MQASVNIILQNSVAYRGGGRAAAPGAGGGRQNGHQNTRKGQGAGFVVRCVPAGCMYAACRRTLFTPYAGGGVIGRWGAPTGHAAPGARHPRYATDRIGSHL
jgi:hypothetical protein